MPFFKLKTGKYLIGTHEREVQLKGTGCLVRTGGGYMYLEEYLKHYSKAECSRLNTLIRKGDGTVKNTVINLLEKYKADKNSVLRYKHMCKSEIDQ